MINNNIEKNMLIKLSSALLSEDEKLIKESLDKCYNIDFIEKNYKYIYTEIVIGYEHLPAFSFNTDNPNEKISSEYKEYLYYKSQLYLINKLLNLQDDSGKIVDLYISLTNFIGIPEKELDIIIKKHI